MLGKGLGAGYAPIAAAVASDHVMEPIMKGSKSVMSGHTLSANPLSCAAALAVLEYLEKHELMKQVDGKSDYLRQLLEKLKRQFTFIGDVRGIGLLFGIELVQDSSAKTPFPRNTMVTQTMVNIAKEKGLLVYPANAGIDGVNGDAIIISPPLTISNKEMEELADLLKDTFLDFSSLMETLEMRGDV